MTYITDEKKDDNGQITMLEARRNIALLLIYFSGAFFDIHYDHDVEGFRVSKSVLLEDLDQLAFDGFVMLRNNSRSVFLTDWGIEKGYELLVQYCNTFNVDVLSK